MKDTNPCFIKKTYYSALHVRPELTVRGTIDSAFDRGPSLVPGESSATSENDGFISCGNRPMLKSLNLRNVFLPLLGSISALKRQAAGRDRVWAEASNTIFFRSTSAFISVARHMLGLVLGLKVAFVLKRLFSILGKMVSHTRHKHQKQSSRDYCLSNHGLLRQQ